MKHTIDLGGAWELFQCGTPGKAIPATAPGCVHGDLLAAGIIPDPYYRDNERRLAWIGEADWRYERSFEVDAAALARDRVLLR